MTSLLSKMVCSSLESSQINIGVKDQIFSFTLLNSEPEKGYNFKWDFDQISQQYISPFLNRISNILIYDFYIDSQILHYGYIISQAPTDDIHVDRIDFASILANYISKDENEYYFYVTDKELQTFVGGTDWNRVSTLINDIAPIQFVVYIPPKSYSPLHIKSDVNDLIARNDYDAFLVPRFGGCVLYNPSLNDTSLQGNRVAIDTNDLYPTFNLVISQLRSLVGLKNNYNDHDDGGDDDVLYLMDESGLNDWELDMLIRENIVSDLQTVQMSLSNIYAMIEKVPELPIKMDVATMISDAVYAFDEALKSCNEERDFIKCIQWTRHSHNLAKKGEYHPAMLPALYFSPEFVYAVYSPYFFPGYIPILAAAVKVRGSCI